MKLPQQVRSQVQLGNEGTVLIALHVMVTSDRSRPSHGVRRLPRSEGGQGQDGSLTLQKVYDGYLRFRRDGGWVWRDSLGMRWRHFMMLGAGLLFLVAGVWAGAAPNQLVPKGLGKKVVVPELLSFQPPAGWIQEETSGDLQMRGPISNGVVPDITVNPGNNGTLSNLKDTFDPEYYDNSNVRLKVVDQTPFVTSAGVKGMRVHLVDKASPPSVVQYSYIFLSPDGQELELACACAPQDAVVYLPVFEVSMKSVVIAKGD
jgi:hypothetical protein